MRPPTGNARCNEEKRNVTFCSQSSGREERRGKASCSYWHQRDGVQKKEDEEDEEESEKRKRKADYIDKLKGEEVKGIGR